MTTNNDAFAEALAEIEEGRLDKGAWARAYAESGGDESKAKALYIKARAASIADSQTWPDTQPPIEDVPKKGVELGDGKDTPVRSSDEYYEAALGERSSDYYIGKFHAFDAKGPGLNASWNWAAFLFGGFWALYRKMYGWFFAWWAVGTVVTFFHQLGEPQFLRGLLVLILVLWASFSVFANSLYHRKVKSRITNAQKSNTDAPRISKRLVAGSGVNMWVPIVCGAIPVLGIVAAVALPAYQDYSKRQTVAAMPVHEASPQETAKQFLDAAAVASPATQIDMSKFEPVEVRTNKQIMEEDGVGGSQNLSDVTAWGQRLLASRIANASSLRKGDEFALLWQRRIANVVNDSPEHALYLAYKLVANFYDQHQQLCRPDTNRDGGILDRGRGGFEAFPQCFAMN